MENGKFFARIFIKDVILKIKKTRCIYIQINKNKKKSAKAHKKVLTYVGKVIIFF